MYFLLEKCVHWRVKRILSFGGITALCASPSEDRHEQSRSVEYITDRRLG